MVNFASMKKILKISNPNDYSEYVGAPVLHPLVAIVHYDELKVHSSLNNYGVYGLFIQRDFPDNLTYGMKPYKTVRGSVIAVAPGQLGGVETDGNLLSLSGWALLWSPELMHDTDLGEMMDRYHFFSYFATDPLKMTEMEWEHITCLLEHLRAEMQQNEDSEALRAVLLGYLRLIMEYCNRIYLRQQEVPQSKDRDILKKFNYLLEEYYRTGQQMRHGVPSVALFAEDLAYSPRYFGDIVHKATGGTAIGYIHSFIVNQGKNLLMRGCSISETAYRLGFEYPHHFSRIFKKVSGMTPREFVGSPGASLHRLSAGCDSETPVICSNG